MILKRIFNCIALRVVILLTTVICVTSCENRERKELVQLVEEWQNKEILFPDSLEFISTEADTLFRHYSIDAPYKVLIFIDSLGCTSCKLQLERWKNFISYVDSIADRRIPFYFILQGDKIDQLRYAMKKTSFDYPICIDKDNLFDELNSFPQKIMFQTFLLDSDNRVKVIGSPVYNLGIRDLYLDYISGTPLHDVEYLTEIKLQQLEFELGEIYLNSTFERDIMIHNVGDHPLHIKGITTSCDCTKAICDWNILNPGEKGSIRIRFNAEEIGDFYRTIEIFGNIKDGVVELTLNGSVI